MGGGEGEERGGEGPGEEGREGGGTERKGVAASLYS